MTPGLSFRVASGSIPVLRLHYSADPRKRPGTLSGEAWLAEAATGYPGGIASARWQKEMEIVYEAFSGTKLFPDWAAWRRWIVVPPFDPQGYKLYGSYDHGWNRPACFLVHGVRADGYKATLWEFYADHVPVPQIAALIKGESVRLLDGRTFEGNPFAGRLTWIRADPDLWAEDQGDKEFKSIAALFRRFGVFFQPAVRGMDGTVAEWLLGVDWLDPTRPRHVITTACPALIRELEGLRHPELSPAVALRKGASERIVDKDCDAWDALKYFLQAFPPGLFSRPRRARGWV